MSMMIPERDSHGNPVMRFRNVADDEFKRVRHKGIVSGSIAAGNNADLDWQIDQLTHYGENKPSIMVGVEVIIDGGNHGDNMDFCVIDIDNVLGYGANTVLDKFGDSFYFAPNESKIIREHKADLYPGLYIRAHYRNTGASAANVYINLLRYMDTE